MSDGLTSGYPVYREPEQNTVQVTDNPAPAIQEPAPTSEEIVQENANMIRKGFEHILNKALEASELARRVAELTLQVQAMRDSLNTLSEELSVERRAHLDTQERLSNVQSTLAQRESTVHDLVMERDIALEERNKAQDERGSARRDAEYWQAEHNSVVLSLANERERNQVLEERNNAMQLRVNAVKEALNGLHSL